MFGYPISNVSQGAKQSRSDKLCPFDNKGKPMCTKASIPNPLGVCSLYDSHEQPVVICPIRFREDKRIFRDAAAFIFPPGTKWEVVPEVTIRDGSGQEAGSIDYVLAAYDSAGMITNFGSVEVQAVYISGNIRSPFTSYMGDLSRSGQFTWGGINYPRADYLSSTRKRLAPQLLYKGTILKWWGKKQAVVLNRGLYDTLPQLPATTKAKADMAWLVYDLVRDARTDQYHLTPSEPIYTEFDAALNGIARPQVPQPTEFLTVLQRKLDSIRPAQTRRKGATALGTS